MFINWRVRTAFADAQVSFVIGLRLSTDMLLPQTLPTPST